jgi:hypothetical protein
VVAEWLYLDWASRAPQPLPNNFVHAEWITLHEVPRRTPSLIVPAGAIVFDRDGLHVLVVEKQRGPERRKRPEIGPVVHRNSFIERRLLSLLSSLRPCLILADIPPIPGG